jgi:5'-nucleotidase
VVSGVNAGANMGDDTLYSGTVAAAMEGRHLGKPSMAVSLVGSTHFETGALIAARLIKQLEKTPYTGASILNLNVPDLPLAQLRGLKVCRLGHRHMAESVVKTTDPRQKTIYWIGAAGEAADSSEGTDFHALAQGYATLTPLQVDLTKHAALTSLTDWLGEEKSFGA